MSSDKDRFLTPKEVSDWLGLAPSTLADLPGAARGQGPAFTRLTLATSGMPLGTWRRGSTSCRVESGAVKAS